MMNQTVCPLDYLRELIDGGLKQLELPVNPKGLYDPVRYVLEGGGKRLRPLLMLSLVEAFGGDATKYVNQALALEIFHNFTLLHDDVMDHAEKRHGRLTVHKKWNEETAILSGDAMLSLASIYMLRNLEPSLTHRVMMVFNETALKVDEGQQADMDFEHDDNVTISEYEEMIMLKTGALFACASAIAVLISVPSDHADFNFLFKNAAKLGYVFGVAFQLQDDLLDTYGDYDSFGKQIGGDILNDKKTWLLINLLKSRYRKDAKNIMADKSISPELKISAIRDLYDRLGLRTKLENNISDNMQKLKGVLSELQPFMKHNGYELLSKYFDQVMGRTR